MLPRLGGLLAYASGRGRTLYGVQLEQPLLPTARFVLGMDASRRTDHGDLQQIDDTENSLLLLAVREDWRDYFEREGAGVYLSWRVPDFSTVSVHLRNDDYRSLASSGHVTSLWRTGRALRSNPAIDDGTAHRAIVRLERIAKHTRRGRSGIYHWIEFEGAGGALGGDFDYSRALADVRSVVRLSPATTLTLRGVGGSALHGALPAQRQFVLGGVDGLRAHAFGSYHGDRVTQRRRGRNAPPTTARDGRPVEADARLRQKNRLTLPGAIVRVLGAAPGDVIVFEADPAEPGTAHLHLLPRSFAGSLQGVYGTGEEVMEYLRSERASWDE